ncbi:MAG: hypothetical protein IJN11_10395 [Oscillospiraceae bacterium]|nr:hypothetical protein [Oscillospiraceae bacterium]
MREILFRGKTYDGKWEQGDLRHGGYVHNDSETYIMRADVALHNIPVDPKTIGQYTGLTDKNGKKIFEGDIITDGYGTAVVKYNESKAAFYVEAVIGGEYLGEEWDADIKIIGNIHDNPELLKGE